MSTEMTRANLISPEQIVLERATIPSPGPGQALLKVAVAGICGSDIHAYFGKHPFISCPVVPGHEFAGTVVAVGPGVRPDLVGQRVTALPSLVCGECFNCRTGRFNICRSLRVIGCQADGAMAEYVAVPADKVLPLPEEMSFAEAALVEPLAVGVHAVRRAGSVAGQRVVVTGAGTIGLLVMQVAKAYGAAEVTVSDLVDFRLRLAEELGADQTVDVRQRSLVNWAQQRYGSDGVDVSFECVGVESTVNDAILIARKGSKVVIVGVFEEDVKVKMGLVQDKEIELIGTLMYTREDYAEALRLLRRGAVRALPLVTHRFPLSQVAEAFRTIKEEKDKAVKVLLEIE
ncbi:MAG: zinc-dependent alcohol dehydrogenase [Betaproteobacteria bacterium]